MIISPKIYLAIDNCVVSKRITKPLEWMEYFKHLGINYIEASADNELDPFYMGMDYLKDWRKEVRKASRLTGQKIVNLFSGHGTYSTLGLGHTDLRVKDHMLHDWLKEMVNTASEIDCGFGFFCHAFPQKILQEPDLFTESWNDLISRFGLIADYAKKLEIHTISVEQMYSPHQVPWTIEQGRKLLSEIQNQTNAPFYLTIDTGHQTGQRRHLMPTEKQLFDEINYCRKESIDSPRIWLGPQKAYQLFREAVRGSLHDKKKYIKEIVLSMQRTPYLFASFSDGNIYEWLEKLGGMSPIIHLQQTDGKSSAHWAFTKDRNVSGIINPQKVLESIQKFYTYGSGIDFLEPVDEIYLTLELFSGTAEYQQDINDKIKESVSYWREYIPEDGLRLEEIIQIYKGNKKEE